MTAQQIFNLTIVIGYIMPAAILCLLHGKIRSAIHRTGKEDPLPYSPDVNRAIDEATFWFMIFCPAVNVYVVLRCIRFTITRKPEK